MVCHWSGLGHGTGPQGIDAGYSPSAYATLSNQIFINDFLHPLSAKTAEMASVNSADWHLHKPHRTLVELVWNEILEIVIKRVIIRCVTCEHDATHSFPQDNETRRTSRKMKQLKNLLAKFYDVAIIDCSGQ